MSTNCPTCGPTVTEQHPRLDDVLRCANCKEWLSTNDSTPDPTAGERDVPALLAALQKAVDAARADRRATSEPDPTAVEHCPAHGESSTYAAPFVGYIREPNCACRMLPATPPTDAATTPASEGLTEAEQSLGIHCGVRHIFMEQDVERIIADREAAAATKARADERERIAQAIRAAADEQVWPKYLAARKQVDQALYQGKFDGMADAAHIARGDG